jgi:hypothetical protein
MVKFNTLRDGKAITIIFAPGEVLGKPPEDYSTILALLKVRRFVLCGQAACRRERQETSKSNVRHIF